MTAHDDAELGGRLATELMDKLTGVSPVVWIIIMGHMVAATELWLKLHGMPVNRKRILRHISQCADGVQVTVRKPS